MWNCGSAPHFPSLHLSDSHQLQRLGPHTESSIDLTLKCSSRKLASQGQLGLLPKQLTSAVGGWGGRVGGKGGGKGQGTGFNLGVVSFGLSWKGCSWHVAGNRPPNTALSVSL